MKENILEFKILTGLNGITEIADEWKYLVKKNNTQEFYHTYEWHLTYIEHLCDNPDSVKFIFAYKNNELIAIFPLTIETRKFSIFSIKVLQFPSHSHITLHDLIIKRDIVPLNNLITEMLRFCSNQADLKWDITCLASVIEGSNIEQQIDTEKPYLTKKQYIGQSYSISSKGSYDETTSHIPKSFRRNIARQERKASKQGNISFERIT